MVNSKYVRFELKNVFQIHTKFTNFQIQQTKQQKILSAGIWITPYYKCRELNNTLGAAFYDLMVVYPKYTCIILVLIDRIPFYGYDGMEIPLLLTILKRDWWSGFTRQECHNKDAIVRCWVEEIVKAEEKYELMVALSSLSFGLSFNSNPSTLLSILLSKTWWGACSNGHGSF